MLNRLSYNAARLVQSLPEAGLDFLIALGLNLIFLALIALLLWPLGQSVLAVRLTKGYGILWVVAVLTAVLLYRVQRFFRVDADTHADAFVLSNLAHSVFLLAGWSAFAALTVHSFVAGAPVWVAALLWFVGLLASYVACTILSPFYQGIVYKMVNAPLALISFLVFAVWPASGRASYGWFFNLF